MQHEPITEQTILKFLAAGGVPHLGNKHFKWPIPEGDQPGDWAYAHRPIIICQRGLHLATVASWSGLVSDELYVAEPGPKCERHIGRGGDKFAVSKARLLWRVETWTPRAARLLACEFAERVLPAYEQTHPGDPRLREGVVAARLFANKTIGPDQLREARNAARRAYGERSAAYHSLTWQEHRDRDREQDDAELAALNVAQAALYCTTDSGTDACASFLREVMGYVCVSRDTGRYEPNYEARKREADHQTARFLAVLNGEPL